jgi:hypothetical protein
MKKYKKKEEKKETPFILFYFSWWDCAGWEEWEEIAPT